LSYAGRALDAEHATTFCEWVDSKVTFPVTTVDRITPSVGNDADGLIVMAEPYRSLIIEECPGLSACQLFQGAGVQFVSDVAPHWRAKSLVVNGGHLILGVLGAKRQYEFAHESAKDPEILELLTGCHEEYNVLAAEATSEYCATTRARFANHALQDRVPRLLENADDKVAERLICPALEYHKASALERHPFCSRMACHKCIVICHPKTWITCPRLSD